MTGPADAPIDRHSRALAGWTTARLLQRLPHEAFWQRRIAELLVYARADELGAAGWLTLRRLADRGELAPAVQFFVRCRAAVADQQVGELLALFPAGCEYPDWIRAAGDLRLAHALVLERWDALLRGRHYAPLHQTRREVVLALGKLGALAGDYFAQRIEESWQPADGAAADDQADDGALRRWAIERTAGSDSEWRPCAVCRHGTIVLCTVVWWRRHVDWAPCCACGGRVWVPARG